MLSKAIENISLGQSEHILLKEPKFVIIRVCILLLSVGTLLVLSVAGAQTDQAFASQSNSNKSNQSISTDSKPLPLDHLYNQPASSQWLVGQDLTIRDWLVAGSGCPKARLSAPDRTKVTLVPSSARIRSYNVIIEVEKYELDGNIPINPQHATFARECTILLSVYPASGKKISNVEAGAAMSAKKSINTAARLAAQVVLGNDNLVGWEKELAKGTDTDFEENIHLTANDKTPFEKVNCEQPKLVGIDYSFISFRDNFNDKILIRLNNGTTTLRLDFADCSANEIEKTNF